MEEIERIYKAYTHLLEMFSDRKYTDLPQNFSSIESFLNYYSNLKPFEIRSKLHFFVKNKNEQRNVIFIASDSLNNDAVVNLKKITEQQKNIKEYTIVYHGTYTPNAKSSIIELNSNFVFEVISEDNLQINITKHEIYSLPHRILSMEEVESLKTKGIDIKKLPIAKRTDAQVLWLDAKKNQILEIRRPDIYYRRVE